MAPRSTKVLPTLAFVGAGGDVAFWVSYWTGLISFGDDPSIASFEAAFPVADALLGAALVGAGIGGLRGKRYGSFFLAVAGAMALYLGVLDVTFYVRRGGYFGIGTDAFTELLINIVCLAGGVAALAGAWRQWMRTDCAATEGPIACAQGP